MTAKFDKFVAALTALCVEHQVHLTASGYEWLEVWNLEDDKPLCEAGIDDWTDPESRR